MSWLDSELSLRITLLRKSIQGRKAFWKNRYDYYYNLEDSWKADAFNLKFYLAIQEQLKK